MVEIELKEVRLTPASLIVPALGLVNGVVMHLRCGLRELEPDHNQIPEPGDSSEVHALSQPPWAADRSRPR